MIPLQWNAVETAHVWPVSTDKSAAVKVYMVTFGADAAGKRFPGVMVGVVAKRFVTFCDGNNYTSADAAKSGLEQLLFLGCKHAIERR